jgi:hypothetical protein
MSGWERIGEPLPAGSRLEGAVMTLIASGIVMLAKGQSSPTARS